MQLSSVNRNRKKTFNFIFTFALVATFPIRFVLLETNVEVNNGQAVQLLRELSGAHLLISASPNPPWLNERVYANGTSTYYGLHATMCDYLAEALNATYTFVRTRKDEENTIGRRDATNNLLQRGEVNISAKFVVLGMVECIFRTVRFPCMEPAPNYWFRFQRKRVVWVLLAISILCVTLSIAYIPKFYEESFRKRGDIGTSVIYVLTGEGGWDKWKYKASFRILQGTWCLAAFVLLNAYSSTIISYLTAPKLSPVAKNLDQVAAGHPQNLKLLLEKDNLMKGRYLDAANGTWKLLGDSIRRNPDCLFLSNEEAVQKLLTGHYTYYHVDMRVMVFMDKLYKASGNRCHFTVFDQVDFGSSAYLAWSFTKNWRYSQAVNHRLKGLAESGLMEYWIKRTLPKLDQCELDNYKKAAEEKRVLSFKDLTGPFLFLLAGMAVSFLAFLIEKIVFKCRQSTGANRVPFNRIEMKTSELL